MVRAGPNNRIPTMTRIFSEALNQILSEPDARVTARELADEAGVSRDMIYKAKNPGTATLSLPGARTLARYMLRQYGDPRLARCFVTAGYEIVPREAAKADGRIQDEVTDLQVIEGQIIQEYRDGDRDDLSEKIGQLQSVVERLKAERDRL